MEIAVKTNKEHAAKLTQDIGDFLRAWGTANVGGPIDVGVALSSFGSLLAYSLASIPDDGVRAASFHSVLKMLVENSNANVLVTAFDCPQAAADSMLASIEPEGSA